MGRTECPDLKQITSEPWLVEQKQEQQLQRERNGALRSARRSTRKKGVRAPTLSERRYYANNRSEEMAGLCQVFRHLYEVLCLPFLGHVSPLPTTSQYGTFRLPVRTLSPCNPPNSWLAVSAISLRRPEALASLELPLLIPSATSSMLKPEAEKFS